MRAGLASAAPCRPLCPPSPSQLRLSLMAAAGRSVSLGVDRPGRKHANLKLRAPEPAWHRRQRAKRAQARILVKLGEACRFLSEHHGSAVPRSLRHVVEGMSESVGTRERAGDVGAQCMQALRCMESTVGQTLEVCQLLLTCLVATPSMPHPRRDSSAARAAA